MSDCRKCQRFDACYFDSDDCIGFVQKTMTNADSIRAMTDEELAEFFFKDTFRAYMKTPKENLDWLKQEAKE